MRSGGITRFVRGLSPGTGRFAWRGIGQQHRVPGSWRVGTVAGVPVAVNWSVLIIFVLLAAGLSGSRFPRAYPGQPAWAYAAAGVGAAVVFLFGLLAHELSHAVVAIRNGLSVRGITLWVFGGVAELQGEAPSPGAELRIAGVGPLMSLLIGVVFGLVAAGTAVTGHTGLVLAAFSWLAGINLALAVFNVLPAAPLDGGRLLRAALWKWRGDRAWAAVMAARAGRGLGWLLVGLGLWQFLAGAGIGGLWLVVIGWFLLGAAGVEERQAGLGAALAGVRVADVMSPQPQTVPPDVSVADFIDRYLLKYRHTAFPLTEDGRPVGLVTLDRVRRVPADQRGVTRLREVACRPEELTIAAPDEPLTNLVPRLSACSDGRALVASEDHLVGIVSPSDVSRAALHGSLRHRVPDRSW
jgi:Zn-dependent protease/predicted transcriptional regulator